ncbi:hypothetical protein Pfl04_04640 [Planosporangium flavigriseum]|uniref:Dolichyl-phosphate-mannose-protein mannosyltransferase n=2 Tax=Planosporangium flavigriseum TaxID=373681 RepID=A0A8J3LVT5_9ACTN|nr:hypothetical protein Pfl04_04640 [Planosporangium flavigriseum]
MLGALFPAATLLLSGYALRPAGATFGPRRLAAVRAAVAVGAFATVGVEVLSAVDAVTTGPVVGLWLTGLAASAVLALLRRRRDVAGGRGSGIRDGIVALWRGASPVERLLGVALAGLVLAELVVALVSPPNNYDSYHYHLPRVEHWVAQGNVALYPTFAKHQVANPPGGEYLLLHLRLLTGGDGLYNLLQWAAALGCALAVSRIAAQLGAGRLGQLLAAATVVGAPMVVLEATSTQNDLVVAAWLACAATLVVDELSRRSPATAVLGIGAAAGLVVVTKPTGWLALGPVLLLWGLAQVRQRALVRAAVGTIAIIAVIGVLAGPYLSRVNAGFGSPLGPPEQSGNHTLQRHDPLSVLVNALRIGSSTLLVPVPQINQAVADGIIGFARAIGVDPQDPATTMYAYPSLRAFPDEDRSPYPVQSALVLIATFGALLARRVPGRVRAYALTVLGALSTYAAVLKWQPWGNRLVGGALILGAPLVGWALSAILARRHALLRPVIAGTVAVVVAGGTLHGYYAVALGAPRPLVGEHSVLLRDEWDLRFARMPGHLAGYEWGAAKVRAAGARRVGIVLIADQWEYPWWVMLPGTDLVSLQSVLPHQPAPPSTSVDAILCAAPQDVCRTFVPAGWRFETIDGWFGFAAPGR